MWYSAGGRPDPQASFLYGSEALQNAHPSLLLPLRRFSPCPISIPAFTPVLVLLGLRLPVAACHECYKYYKWGDEISHKSPKRLGCWVKVCGRTASYERTSTEVWGKEREGACGVRGLCVYLAALALQITLSGYKCPRLNLEGPVSSGLFVHRMDCTPCWLRISVWIP